MRTELYPEIEIYKEHMIPVSPLHTIYVEESGNPLGHPVVVLHGGPGGASSPGIVSFLIQSFIASSNSINVDVERVPLLHR